MADFQALLIPSALAALADGWIAADIPKFDVGGFVVGSERTTATLMCKSPGVVCGTPFATAVIERCGCTVVWLKAEGDVVTEEEAGSKVVVANVEGPARSLLQCERTALNVLARASGVATAARKVSERVAAKGWAGKVCGTRKTTPGFGLVEKYALLVGGAGTHRMDLSAMVMLKDNHIWAVGSITTAVRKARSAGGFSTKIEVECRDLAEAKEAAAAGADICMLDNFTPEEIHRDAALLKELYPHVVVEASGGITLDKIEGYLSPAVDVISQGSLTQGYTVVDFSMKLPRPSHMAGVATA